MTSTETKSTRAGARASIANARTTASRQFSRRFSLDHAPTPSYRYQSEKQRRATRIAYIKKGKNVLFNVLRSPLKSAFVMLFTILLFAMAANAALAAPPSFGGCYITSLKENVMLSDLDCDKVADAIDNCPLVPNPEQFDQTGNGLGDACDLLIEKITAEPPVVLQGRALIVHYQLTNYREYPLRNLQIHAEIPVLGVADDMEIESLPSVATTNQELILRIPDCAYPGEYDLVLVVEYPYTAGKKEVFSRTIKVATLASGECPIEPTSADKTVVDIIEIQDVDPIDGAVYPFTISNNEMFSKAYVLSVEGTKGWGSSQIEPGTLIVVPAGESREGAVKVWADEGVTGEHGFHLTVQARDDIQQVMLLADIPEEPGLGVMGVLLIVVGVLLLIGIIIAVVLLLRARDQQHRIKG